MGPTGPAASLTLEEAQALLAELLPLTREVIDVRARLVVATHDDPPAPVADRKALEAQLSDLLDRIVARGVQLKGWAPLLIDLPGRLNGRAVLWCWLEGEPRLAWYHDAAHGFAGRRPIGS